MFFDVAVCEFEEVGLVWNLDWRLLQELDVENIVKEVEEAVEFLLWIGYAVLLLPTLR